MKEGKGFWNWDWLCNEEQEFADKTINKYDLAEPHFAIYFTEKSAALANSNNNDDDTVLYKKSFHWQNLLKVKYDRIKLAMCSDYRDIYGKYLKMSNRSCFFKVHFTACIPDNWYVLYAHLDGRWCIDKSVWLSGPDACKYVLQAWKPTKQSNTMLIHTSSSSTCCSNAHCISFIRKFSTLVRLNFVHWLD